MPRGDISDRKNARIAIRLGAEVQHGGTVFTAVTRDLSEGGVCLEADRALPEGNSMVVGLFLVVDGVEDATQPSLEMQGKVAWAVPPEDGQPATMGIRFEAVSPAQAAGLMRYIKMVPESSPS